jgi:hypothetical protein
MPEFRLSNYFRNQLPESIRAIVDHPDYDPLGEWVEGYRSIVQYAYPVVSPNGDPSDTTLATVMSMEPIDVHEGQEIALHSKCVVVDSVITEEERSESDGRTIIWHTATVKEKAAE